MYDVVLKTSVFPAAADGELAETTIGSVLQDAAAARPNALALIEVTAAGDVGRTWTTAQLSADCERLAGTLLTRFEPGERVAVWAPNSPEWVMLEFACGLAGLTLVTVNPSYQADELRYVLAQSRSVGLFMVNEHRGNPMRAIADVATQGLVALRERVDLDDHAALFEMRGAMPDLPRIDPMDPAMIQYTSGTTGRPKGAVLHHKGMTNNARLTYERFSVGPEDRVLNYMPMFHVSGCLLATLGTVQSGAAHYIAKVFDPFAMNAVIGREKITVAAGVPTMTLAMLEAHAVRPADYGSVRLSGSGGSMVPPELIARVKAEMGCEFQTVYGQTETCAVVCQTRHDDADDDLYYTVGQPLPFTDVAIVAPGGDALLPLGEIGEICVRGYCVMLGYNDNPEATSAAISEDGWLRTGDLGAMDARGYVTITGRVKEMIIRGGENLFPAEIENVLLAAPGVAEVAVVGAPDAKWGEIAVAFVRPAPGVDVTAEALHAHCRAKLSPQKTPAAFVFVQTFPLTGSGKIRKFLLRDAYMSGDLSALQSPPLAPVGRPGPSLAAPAPRATGPGVAAPKPTAPGAPAPKPASSPVQPVAKSAPTSPPTPAAVPAPTPDPAPVPAPMPEPSPPSQAEASPPPPPTPKPEAPAPTPPNAAQPEPVRAAPPAPPPAPKPRPEPSAAPTQPPPASDAVEESAVAPDPDELFPTRKTFAIRPLPEDRRGPFGFLRRKPKPPKAGG